MPTSLCLVIIIIIITPAAVLASFAAVALVAVTLYIVVAQVVFGQTAAPAVWVSVKAFRGFPAVAARGVIFFWSSPSGRPPEYRSALWAKSSAPAPPPRTGKEADFLALDAKAPAARFTGSSQRETGLIGEAGRGFRGKGKAQTWLSRAQDHLTKQVCLRS